MKKLIGVGLVVLLVASLATCLVKKHRAKNAALGEDELETAWGAG